MTENSNPINFFEIPVTDFERARSFYQTVTGWKLEVMEMNGFRFGFFPRGDFVGGAIVQGEGYQPSRSGTLVYLNGGGDFDGMLARAEQAGGSVAMPRTSIGEHGFIARFVDTEGNLVALHTM